MKTPTIPIGQIEIGARFRKQYGDIDQLAFSIKTKGLINPITVGVAEKMKVKRETDLPFILLAGGRRMQALKSLGYSMIPVRIYDTPLSEEVKAYIEEKKYLIKKMNAGVEGEGDWVGFLIG